MVIRELGLISFRNYQELFHNFSDGINLFLGENGQGKTNLLEALYLLTHLASFRTRKLQPLIRAGESQGFVQATIIERDTAKKSRIEISRKGKKVWLDSVIVPRSSTYIQKFYSLLFNADNLFSLRHYPGERRSFMDRYISFVDPAYFQAVKDMRVVLSQKNKILKSGVATGLEEWNELLIQKGHAILQGRETAVRLINESLPEIFRDVTMRGENLQLVYQPSLSGEREQWSETLKRIEPRERALGHALLGPHRDEFHMEMAPGRTDEVFSQGEYRIAVLALLFAINETLARGVGFVPVLILDDLFSELDGKVQAGLLGYLGGLPNQIFITTTHQPEGFRPETAQVREIRAGQVV